MLTGEWGCGKTHLVRTDLAEALQETHVIARVSLFGVDSVDALHDAVKRQWLAACTPVLGKIQKEKDRVGKSGNKEILNTLAGLLSIANPFAGNVAKAVVAVNPLDFIPIEPEVEDIRSHRRKKVILVFDDMERSKLDLVELLGSINEYSENQRFNTIIVTNEDYLNLASANEVEAYRLLKEKIVCRTVLNNPDYRVIIPEIIEKNSWNHQDYADFLADHEYMIREVFASSPSELEEGNAPLEKLHNIRSLITSLRSFYRIYHHMNDAGVPDIEKYLYSFIAFSAATKCGILKNGRVCFETTDEEIHSLYPWYTADTILASVRQWITLGVWDQDRFSEELEKIAPQQTEEAPAES